MENYNYLAELVQQQNKKIIELMKTIGVHTDILDKLVEKIEILELEILHNKKDNDV